MPRYQLCGGRARHKTLMNCITVDRSYGDEYTIIARVTRTAIPIHGDTRKSTKNFYLRTKTTQ